jgi:hypothetical protein
MKKLILIAAAFALVATGCHHMDSVRGSGKRQVQKREVSPFTSISTEGAFNIDVVCQKAQSLEIEGDDNILPLVSTEVSNNVLYLKTLKNYSVGTPIVVRIAVPNLGALSVSGAGKIDIVGLKSENFVIDANGAPQINVSGTAKVINIDSNGAAKIDTHSLHASKAVVESKGVSRIDVDVADQLDVTISGPSTVTYEGDPTINKTIHGPGKLQKRASEGAWEIRIANLGFRTS